jgi:anti-sigma regulatory factor (Ser/Thr protein kinase)
MKELTVAATVENIETVTDFVNEQLEALDCPMKAQMQIDIAIDELFGNIAHYAYNPEIGKATVRVEVIEDPLAVVITFIDKGVPYDPLAKADPDTTLSAEERDIGGLGIYMVKKSMDEIIYEYKDGQNTLKIKKNIGG